MSRFSEMEEGYRAGSRATSRPAVVTDDHLAFLDALREDGSVNMLGARPSLMAEFDILTAGEAATVLGYWLKTYGEPSR